jgi:hypothetical protein
VQEFPNLFGQIGEMPANLQFFLRSKLKQSKQKTVDMQAFDQHRDGHLPWIPGLEG